MHGFAADLLHECRQMLKHRSYTATAVLVLSVAIGANTLMFSGANSVLFRPLPFDDSPRVVNVRSTNPASGFERTGISPPDFSDLRQRARSFDSLPALSVRPSTLVPKTGDPERIFCGLISSDLFSALRVRPILGRDFIAPDDRPLAPKVAILSYGLWGRRYGKDPAILGQSVNMDGDEYIVIGIMASEFWFPSRNVELWAPLQLDPLRARRTDRFLTVIGSLRNGVTAAGAQAEADALARTLADQNPATNAGWGITVTPLRDDRLGTLARTALFVLLVAVGFVLLIAAANVANMLLAQMTARRRELAIRVSLGAGRWRLIRQMLVQSVVLALFGALGGLAFTIWVKPILTNAIPAYMRDYNDLILDHRVLAYNMILPLITCLICGIMPAIQLSRPALNDFIQEAAEKGGTTQTRRSAFSLLLVAEIALSIVMMIGTGLAIRGFLHLATFDFGFRTDDVLTFRIELPARSYGDSSHQENFYKRLIADVRSLPGVLTVSATDALPVSGRIRRSGAVVPVRVVGKTTQIQAQNASAMQHIVMPHFFEGMGIPLLTGRSFSGHDDRSATPVAIVSDAFRRQHLSGRDPIGARIEIGQASLVQVIGVVGSIRTEGPDRSPVPEMYVPYAQNVTGSMTVVVRQNGDPAQLASAIRARVREIDRLLPVEEIATMPVVVGESYAGPHMFVWMCAAFASIAALIAGAGMYSVMSYYVSRRTHEMGIRIALGARRRHIYGSILGYAAALVLAGAAIGIPCGIALSQTMKRLLFGISPFDPLVYAGLGVFLISATLAACCGPVRRAVRIDPAACIREP